MAEAGTSSNKCKVCDVAFDSKNKLFKHLKSSDGCQVPSKVKALFPKQDKGEAPQQPVKKARTSTLCGRCHVSIAQQDCDVEPDESLLPEKLRLIKLAGINTDTPIAVCGCDATGGTADEGLIPAEVMRGNFLKRQLYSTCVLEKCKGY